MNLNEKEKNMVQHSVRTAYLHRDHCQLLFKSKKTAGILMAIPFVVCFALFGIFNLIGGTVLTSMACKPKFSKQTFGIIQRLLEEQSKQMENFLDPMKVVGIILLVTGSLLILLGILLGIVACRSINFDNRMNSSKRKTSWASFSGVQQLSSANGPVTSYAVMTTLGSMSGTNKTKSKLTLDNLCQSDKTSTTSFMKTVVDIDIHRVEDENSVSTNGGPPEHLERQDLCRTPSDCTDGLSKKTCSVSWASSISPSKLQSLGSLGDVKQKHTLTGEPP